jgi:hypothetical protein
LQVVEAAAVLLIVVPMQVPVAVGLEVIAQVPFLLPQPVTQSPLVVAGAGARLVPQEATLGPKAVIPFSLLSLQLAAEKLLVATKVQEEPADQAPVVVRDQEAVLLLEEPEIKVASLQWKVMQVAQVIITEPERVVAVAQVPLV